MLRESFHGVFFFHDEDVFNHVLWGKDVMTSLFMISRSCHLSVDCFEHKGYNLALISRGSIRVKLR